MAVKYRRTGTSGEPRGGYFSDQAGRRLNPEALKRRLLLIYMGIAGVTAALFMYYIMSQFGAPAGLPSRSGEATVQGKTVENEGTPDERFFLRLRVSVPPASAEEADFVPADAPGRAALLGPLEIDTSVVTTIESWRRVQPGDVLYVEYRPSPGRDRVLIDTISVDPGVGVPPSGETP